MRRCVVAGCTSVLGDKHTFFKLPRQPDLLRKWRDAIGRDPLPMSSVVCSIHFKANCVLDKGFRYILVPGSVPTEKMSIMTRPDHCYARERLKTSEVLPGSKLVELDHNYCLPSAKELKLRLDFQVSRAEKHRLNAQRHSMARLRLRRKVSKLGEIIKDLENSRMISEKAAEMLSGWNDTSVTGDLYKRLRLNSRTKCTSRQEYPPELKAFALTLSFYSSKAYRYVRNTFRLALPHPSTITSWYSNINGEPGFSEECLATLKARQEEKRRQGKSLHLALILDEMTLMSRLEYDGQHFRGEVDLGFQNDDNGILATQALVFLVVCVNENWKLPVAFFFIHSLNGNERANLVKIAVTKLESIHLPPMSLTCDGPSCNKAMMEELGVSLDSRKIIPYFVSDGGNKVYVLLDFCHLIKLVRNAFEKQGYFVDPQGRKIEWRFVTELVKLQDEQGFRCGNKLTKTHIHFHNSKMSVKLATQLLSSSVADSIEYCTDYLKLPQFQGSQATVFFIRCIDRLFDWGNSRNPCVRNYKSPLRPNSHMIWQNFIETTTGYLQQLKAPTGTLMVCTPRKTGFLGLLLGIKSIRGLYNDYVQSRRLKYLLTYKLSQDHLELYFCAVRSGLGHNDNPSCKEFINIFKKLMVRNHVKGWKGNCLALDDTVILSTTSTRPSKDIDAEEISLYKRLDVSYKERDTDQAVDDELEWMDLFSPLATAINYKDAVLTHIAGFVVRRVLQAIKCPVCANALEADMSNGLRNNYSLVAMKTNGGLIFPSTSVVRICKAVEKQFALLERSKSLSWNEGNILFRYVTVPVVTELIEDAN